jgi:flagellar motor switch protein FliM
LKLLQSTGLMTICYPYVALESIIGKLSAQNWIDATKRKSQAQEAETNRTNLLALQMPVSAVLATTDVRIRDFLNMSLGDIITTDRKISEEVDVFVRERPKFMARPGLVGKKKGLVITQVLQELGKE